MRDCHEPVKQDFECDDSMEEAWAKAMANYCEEHQRELNNLPMWSFERVRLILNLGLD